MDAAGPMQGRDPQHLLAQLNQEYERSRRFLEKLENSFVREPHPTQALGPTYAPAWPDEPVNSHAPAPDPTVDACYPLAGHKSQPDSTPFKLRAKLRSFFSRRTIERAEPSGVQAVTRTPSESQSMMVTPSSQSVGALSSERPVAASPTPGPVRRASQIYYVANSPTDVPRMPHAATDSRPTTATRRSSIVNFSGDAMDATSQGWVARVAVAGVGGDVGATSADRPATAHRASLVFYGTSSSADAGAPEPSRGVQRSADFGASTTTALPEWPGTARSGSVVQFNDAVVVHGDGYGNCSSSGQHPSNLGDFDPGQSSSSCKGDSEIASAVAVASGGHCAAPGAAKWRLLVHASGAGGGSGTLQDKTNPYEFMLLMAGPRRSTSFQQRSGTALLPTSQRLRSATARRKSIEVYCSRGPAQQQPQTHQQSAPHAQSQPQAQLQTQSQQPHRGSREPFEARQTVFGALPPDHVSAQGRRGGSLEISRPFSAAMRQKTATTTATAPAGNTTAAARTSVNINSSALFAPASATSLTGATAAQAAAAGVSCQEASSSSSPQGPGMRFRLQQPLLGTAWAPLTVPSPSNSAGSMSPASPADAATVLTVGRGRVAGLAGSPAFRTTMSLSCKRLIDLPEGASVASATASPSPSHHSQSLNATAAEAPVSLAEERGTGVATPSCDSMAPHESTDNPNEASAVEVAATFTSSGDGGGGMSTSQEVQPPKKLQPSSPAPSHQPHPPPQPYTSPQQAHAGFRLRGFVTGDGCGSIAATPPTNQFDGTEPHRDATLRMDGCIRSALGCDGVMQSAT